MAHFESLAFLDTDEIQKGKKLQWLSSHELSYWGGGGKQALKRKRQREKERGEEGRVGREPMRSALKKEVDGCLPAPAQI